MVCMCVLSHAYNHVECVCEGDCFHCPTLQLDSYVPVHRGIVQALAGQQSPDLLDILDLTIRHLGLDILGHFHSTIHC